MAATFTPPNVLMMNARNGKIPSTSASLILEQVMANSAIMQLATYEEMDGAPKKEFTYQTGGIGAYWVGEGQRIQTSRPQWAAATMEAKKIGVIIPVTKEFLNYTAQQFFDQMKPLIAEAFYQRFDQAALWGNDSPFAAEHSVWADITASGNTVAAGSTPNLYTDLNGVIGLIEEGDGDPDGFVTTRAMNQRLRGTVDAQNRPIFNEVGGGAPNAILGLPTSYANKKSWDASKALVLTGDWDYARYGVLQDIEYTISEDATLTTIVGDDGAPVNLFERDMIAMKATMSVAFMKLKEGNFAALTPAAPVTP